MDKVCARYNAIYPVIPYRDRDCPTALLNQGSGPVAEVSGGYRLGRRVSVAPPPGGGAQLSHPITSASD